jgi:hypothetical protein
MGPHILQNRKTKENGKQRRKEKKKKKKAHCTWA